MTTKKEVLNYIQILAAEQAVTPEEIMQAYRAGSQLKTKPATVKKMAMAELLYYIGGGIVFLGIAILIDQNWSILTFWTRVLLSLGVGIATYCSGFLFSREEITQTVSSVFYFISAVMMPLGLYVVLDRIHIFSYYTSLPCLISGILFGIYLVSAVFYRKNILTFCSIIFGTWFYFSFLTYMFYTFSHSIYFPFFFEYKTLSGGLIYILLGYVFSNKKQPLFSQFFYNLGIVGFLGAAFSLGGWIPHQNLFWEGSFPFLIMITLFLSITIRNRLWLVWGTLFFMAFILKITSEYFAHTFGWPLTLVIAGLAIIGVGYIALIIKKKCFLSSQSPSIF